MEAQQVAGVADGTDELKLVESHRNPGSYYYINEEPGFDEGILCLSGYGLATYDSYEIVGESHYQDALLNIVGGVRDHTIYFYAIALLEREPENPQDSNAIVVKIQGNIVGHISRDDNVKMLQDFEALGIKGAAQCSAIIIGGRADGIQTPSSFGVKLDLRFPLKLDKQMNSQLHVKPATS